MALRLHARVKSKPAATDLIDDPLPPDKGHPDERSLKSAECYTPGGLPVRFHAHFRADWGDITVESAGAVLLKMSAHVNSHAELRLPTEEMIEIAVTNY